MAACLCGQALLPGYALPLPACRPVVGVSLPASPRLPGQPLCADTLAAISTSTGHGGGCVGRGFSAAAAPGRPCGVPLTRPSLPTPRSGHPEHPLVRRGGRLQCDGDRPAGAQLGGPVQLLQPQVQPQDGAHAGRPDGEGKAWAAAAAAGAHLLLWRWCWRGWDWGGVGVVVGWEGGFVSA